MTLRTFGNLRETVLLQSQPWQGFGGDCVKNLVTHVVDGVLDGKPLENEARDYLKVIALEKAIYEADREGRKIRDVAYA